MAWTAIKKSDIKIANRMVVGDLPILLSPTDSLVQSPATKEKRQIRMVNAIASSKSKIFCRGDQIVRWQICIDQL